MLSAFTLLEEAGPVKILARRLRSGLASSGPELGGKVKCSRVFRMYPITIPKREEEAPGPESPCVGEALGLDSGGKGRDK